MHTQASMGRGIPVFVLLSASVLACNLQARVPGSAPQVPAAGVSTATLTATTCLGLPRPRLPPIRRQSPPHLNRDRHPCHCERRRAVDSRFAVGLARITTRSAAFLDGQSSTATGCDEDGNWILINIPNTSKSLGWITLETKYTTVNGEVAALPPMQMAPALPAVHPQLHWSRDADQSIGAVAAQGVLREPASVLPGEYRSSTWRLRRLAT